MKAALIPRSEMGSLRRNLIDAIDFANKVTYPLELRRKENKSLPYISTEIDFKDNVANSLAKQFYKDHGVTKIENAIEISKAPISSGTTLMTTRHCILRELGMCKKNKNSRISEPLILSSGSNSYSLKFNCDKCEMQVLYR